MSMVYYNFSQLQHPALIPQTTSYISERMKLRHFSRTFNTIYQQIQESIGCKDGLVESNKKLQWPIKMATVKCLSDYDIPLWYSRQRADTLQGEMRSNVLENLKKNIMKTKLREFKNSQVFFFVSSMTFKPLKFCFQIQVHSIQSYSFGRAFYNYLLSSNLFSPCHG